MCLSLRASSDQSHGEVVMLQVHVTSSFISVDVTYYFIRVFVVRHGQFRLFHSKYT